MSTRVDTCPDLSSKEDGISVLCRSIQKLSFNNLGKARIVRKDDNTYIVGIDIISIVTGKDNVESSKMFSAMNEDDKKELEDYSTEHQFDGTILYFSYFRFAVFIIQVRGILRTLLQNHNTFS